MKESSPIVIFANPVFEGEGLASTVELAKGISEHQEVLFINFPMTFTQLIKGQEPLRLLRATGLKSRLYQPIEELSKLWVLEMPLMLPSNKIGSEKLYHKVLARNNRTYRLHVHRVIERLNWSSTIAVNAFNPLYLEAFTSVNAIKHVYYCYDNIEAAYWLSRHGATLEKKLAAQVDEIYVSSQALKEKFSALNRPVVWIPNGMQPNHFKRTTAFPVHAFHAAYIGALDDRIDYELLQHLLRHFIDFRITLVGPIKCEEAQVLIQHERVCYLGLKKPSEVGQLIQDCDIGLIPFVKNEFTRFIYPLKINEYLCLGMSVLTTDFADLSVFSEWVTPVSSIQEAIDELECIKGHKDVFEMVEGRIKFAQLQSWQARAQKMRTHLNG